MPVKLTLNDYYNALSLVEYRTITQITKNIFEAKGLQDPEKVMAADYRDYIDKHIPGFTYKRYLALNNLVRDELATADYLPLTPEQLEKNAALPSGSIYRTIPRRVWKKLPTGIKNQNANRLGLFSLDDLMPA